ncbi:hypothetical protein ACFWBN_23300 [Streptomyces sp. NPDC059989]|uniref:hypothetical protein n=1 Tax=Streptomyces sp. NPDC059989 TaxID=3347026 RepID=UPI00367BA3B1
MDFSGYSTDLVVAGPAGHLFRRFSVRLEERWPAHLVNGEIFRSFDFGSTSIDFESDDMTSDIVTFSRDREMEEFWEEEGYSLDATGEGPVGIFYKPFKRLSIRVDRGVEVENETSWQDAYIAIPEGLHLSLATPGDPSSDAFSGWVRSCLIQSLWDAPPTIGSSN